MHVAELVQILNMNKVESERSQQQENQKGSGKGQYQNAKSSSHVCDARFLVLAPDAIVQHVTDSDDNDHSNSNGMMKMKSRYVGTGTKDDDKDDADATADADGDEKERNRLGVSIKDNDGDNKSPVSPSSLSSSTPLMMIPKPWYLMKTDNRTAEALDVQWIIVPFRVLLFSNALQLSSSSLSFLANGKLSSFLVMHLHKQTLPSMITHTNVEGYPVR